MNTPGITDAEQAALSSLSYTHTPPEPGAGLRLAYSRTNVEDLVGAIARTRRDLYKAKTLSLELSAQASDAVQAVAHLIELEQRQVLALNHYIDNLSRCA